MSARRLVVVALAGALVASACSGGKKDAAEPAETLPTVPDISVPSTAAPTTAADRTPAPEWVETPAEGAWVAVDKAPIPARSKPTMVDLDGAVLVWGGTAGGKQLVDGAVFEIDSETWTAVPDAPVTVAADTAVATVWTGSEAIIVGRGAAGDAGFALAFDPFANTWQVLTPPGGPILDVVWTGERVQALWQSTGAVVAAGLDVATGVWQPLPAIPEAKAVQESVWFEGDWVAKLDDAVWFLPSGATAWTKVAFRGGLTVRPEAVLTNREFRVYLATVCGATLQIDAASGGATAIGKVGCIEPHPPASVNSGWLLDAEAGPDQADLALIEPATGRRIELPDATFGTRSGSAAVVLNDGAVFLWGGSAGSGASTLVDGALWVLKPPPPPPDEELEDE